MEENKIENSVLEENSNVEAAETHAENSTNSKDEDKRKQEQEVESEETPNK